MISNSNGMPNRFNDDVVIASEQSNNKYNLDRENNCKYFKNYGYTVPGQMKGKLGIVSITYGGPMISYFNFSIFDNIPYRRIKKSVFNLGGMKTKYIRFYSVLPNMLKKDFNKHMLRVRKLVRDL